MPPIAPLPAAPVRLLATDLDGTLLRSDGSLSDRTRRALHAAQAAGLAVVLASARAPASMRQLAVRAGVTGWAICCNGAIVYDLSAGRIAQYRPLALDLLPGLLRRLRAEIPGLTFGWEIGTGFGCEPAYLALRPAGLPPPAAVGDPLDLCTTPPAKVTARHATLGAEDLLARARALAGSDVLITHSDPFLLEISAAGVDKGVALAGLCAAHGIAPAEVVAFGDMPNDLAMLLWAGRGVAMANAHPAVQAAAAEMTLSNDADGVAVVVERLLAGRGPSIR